MKDWIFEMVTALSVGYFHGAQRGRWKPEDRHLPAGPDIIAGLQARSCTLMTEETEAVTDRKGNSRQTVN